MLPRCVLGWRNKTQLRLWREEGSVGKPRSNSWCWTGLLVGREGRRPQSSSGSSYQCQCECFIAVDIGSLSWSKRDNLEGKRRDGDRVSPSPQTRNVSVRRLSQSFSLLTFLARGGELWAVLCVSLVTSSLAWLVPLWLRNTMKIRNCLALLATVRSNSHSTLLEPWCEGSWLVNAIYFQKYSRGSCEKRKRELRPGIRDQTWRDCDYYWGLTD